MAESNATADGKAAEAPPRRRRLRLVIFAAIPLLLAGGGAGAYFLVPGVGDAIKGLIGGKHTAPEQSADAAPKPTYVDIPEMTVTLPNGGRPRQMRIRISLELAKFDPDKKPQELLSPQVNDALVTYLRTLRDNEIDGAVAVDRLRGDLFRRLDLVLGSGVLSGVLITSLVVG